MSPVDSGILQQIKRLLRNHRLRYEGHAKFQMQARMITYPEVEYVLSVSGAHMAQRDRWDEKRQAVNHVIEGETVDRRPLRVVVCILSDPPIPEELLLVITAIDLNR